MVVKENLLPPASGSAAAAVFYLLPNKLLSRIQMKEVVRMARMVPMGMDLWASRRSPDLLEPAMIPGRTKANTAEGHSSEPLGLGRLLNHSLD